jgi:hypothetical protein
MSGTISDWLPVALRFVAESGFYLTMFIPAFLVSRAIIRVRQRQLDRTPLRRSSDGKDAGAFLG